MPAENTPTGIIAPRQERSRETLHRLLDAAEELLDGTCVAIVAPQPAVFGIARMYQLLRDPPYEVRVFRELAKAEAWLDGRVSKSGTP